MSKNKEEIQQKYIEMQFLMQHMQQLQQQSQMIEQQFLELKAVDESLNSLTNSKEDTKSFSLIGAGIFAESQIKNTQNILMNVGSKVVLRKTIPEAKELLKKQMQELEKILINMEHQMQEINNRLQESQIDLQQSS